MKKVYLDKRLIFLVLILSLSVFNFSSTSGGVAAGLELGVKYLYDVKGTVIKIIYLALAIYVVVQALEAYVTDQYNQLFKKVVMAGLVGSIAFGIDKILNAVGGTIIYLN